MVVSSNCIGSRVGVLSAFDASFNFRSIVSFFIPSIFSLWRLQNGERRLSSCVGARSNNRGKGTLLTGEGRGSDCAMNHLRDATMGSTLLDATMGSTLLDATMGSPLLDATMGSQFHGYRPRLRGATMGSTLLDATLGSKFQCYRARLTEILSITDGDVGKA